jgi:hypothetical protein
LKKKARSIVDGADAIHELIARVCGLLAPAASFDDAAKQAYEQLFINAPLATSAIHALEALVKHVKKMKKKKGTAPPPAATVTTTTDD